jgi:uncharacterized membrane protein YbhN (UPF0104 family)
MKRYLYEDAILLTAKVDLVSQFRRLKIVVRVFAYAILAIAVFFVLRRLIVELEEIRDKLTWHVGALIAMCTIAHWFSLYALSLAWFVLLRRFDNIPGSLLDWQAIYSRSAIAKYVPGNVFHFAGRHLLGRKMGVHDALLVTAALYEILGLVTAAAVLILLGASQLPQQYVFINPVFSAAIAAVAISTVLAIARFLPIVASRLGMKVVDFGHHRSLKQGLSLSLLLYLFYLGTSAIIAYFVATQTDATVQASVVIPAFAAAWLAGFVVPGASGGIGVREAVFLILVEPTIGSANGVFVAVAMRVITTLGDLVFFLA